DRGAGLPGVRQHDDPGAHLHRGRQAARVARHVVGPVAGVRARGVAVLAPVRGAPRAHGRCRQGIALMPAWPRQLRIKRADWLIAISVLVSLMLAWLVIVGLDTFQEFARQIGNIGHNGYSLGQAVAYILLTVPRRIYDWFVFAALIGSLLGLGGLAASNELTALRAAGMSKLRISLSAAGTVAVLMVGVFILGETAAPVGEQRAQNIQLALNSGKLGMTQRSGLWAKDGDAIINAKAALAHVVNGRPAVELADVRVFGFNDAGELTSFQWAKTATQQSGQWIMHDVRSTDISTRGAHTVT